MENGNMTSKEMADTSQVTVWFTPAIPVSAGPDFEGQLPGLILEIDINGTPTYKAIEVSPKVNIASIKEPRGGKKVTEEVFEKERDKAMQQMQRNGPVNMRIGGWFARTIATIIEPGDERHSLDAW